MNDVAAAIGIHQLARLDAWLERREVLARSYDEQLRDLRLELAPPVPDGARHARHLYTVTVPPDAPVTRDELIVALGVRNIGTSVHFHGVHLHRYYRDRYGLRPEDLPNSTAWSARTLTLPLFPAMDEDDVAAVAGALADALAPIGSSA